MHSTLTFEQMEGTSDSLFWRGDSNLQWICSTSAAPYTYSVSFLSRLWPETRRWEEEAEKIMGTDAKVTIWQSKAELEGFINHVMLYINPSWRRNNIWKSWNNVISPTEFKEQQLFCNRLQFRMILNTSHSVEHSDFQFSLSDLRTKSQLQCAITFAVSHFG